MSPVGRHTDEEKKETLQIRMAESGERRSKYQTANFLKNFGEKSQV
jgi:hypothetical protein